MEYYVVRLIVMEEEKVVIVLWIAGLIVTYLIIYAAVKEAIDKSAVGQIIIKKFGDKEDKLTISNEEIEKELEDDERR